MIIKKLVLKGCVLGVVLSGFFFYANYLSTGRLPTVPDIGLDQAKSTVSGLGETIKSWISGIGGFTESTADSSGDPEIPGTIYRWQDDQGSVHYGDQPPEGALNLELISDIDPNVNLMQLPKAEPASKPASIQSRQPGSQETNPYGADGARQVLDKAREARDLMNERNQRQQEILDKI